MHFSIIPASVLAPSSPSAASTEAKRLAHNLAQFVHCLAQGKVGSGFDVSAAVFGSHLYRRFSPEVIQPLMQDEKVCLKTRFINVTGNSNPIAG